MKILAIRGCNLASLAGEFEIDLAHGPLSEAGVFAIVGPTGAGKSTLLDAMCVALFDRTPRLTNRSTVVVGRGEDDPAALGAQDVRTLLRRGASTGWAEVDFESGDRQRYRARWSVRRARNASDGNLQDQQVTFRAIHEDGIDGGAVTGFRGGTKTETLKAIQQCLGLTFDQFRRSALLAQGEFAAFLRAEGKDRSELLERMTGTEIYSRLSIAAHARAALAEQALRGQHQAAMAITVFPEEVRAETVAELAAANGERETVRQRLARAETVARWRAEAERRERALVESEAGVQAADLARAAVEPLRGELELRRRAETLRAPWDEEMRAQRQLAIARGDVARAGEAEQQATEARVRIAARQASLAALREPVRAARIAAGIVERARRASPRAEAEAVEAAEPAAWLIARQGLATEIAAWPELEAKLDQDRALAEGIAGADRALSEHARRRDELTAKQRTVAAERDTAAEKLAELTREAERFHQRRTVTLDAAGRLEDEARAQAAEVDKLVAIAAAARAGTAALGAALAQLAELARSDREATARRAAIVRDRDDTELQRTERLRAMTDLRRAAGYVHARAELVDGEPCPLCGAEDHPWKDRGAFDALIGEAEQRHGEAVARYDAAIAALALEDAQDRQRMGERARLDADRTAAETSLEAASRAWREQLTGLGELVLVADPAAPAAEQLASERVELARGRLEAARATRSQAEAAAKAIGDAQARVQVCQADVDHHQTQLRELAAALASAEAAIERVAGERTGRLEQRAALAGVLEAAFARWAVALPADDRVKLGMGTGKRARPRAEAIDRGALAELAAAWRARAEAVANSDASLAHALAEIDREMRDAERDLAAHTARYAEAARRCNDLSEAAFAAAAGLDTARSSARFERDELRRLLADEPGRIDVLAEHLASVERGVERARTLVDERRRLVVDHREQRPEVLDSDPAALVDADQLDVLARAVTAADHRAAAVAAALAADDEARGRRALALAAFAEAERAAEIDRVLGEVIGSHDGKLFRSFAQSLTLDGLLAVANSHLEELAPRYQLERVPKHDLELQVIDRDLGGEVRSVQSLSGGESFLVSLALALGLSSMSAHDVRVRTLLIDEGFGTLDPTTLDSALAVLDRLQATGRQVGVISHVPALVERVGAHIRVAPRGGGRSEVVLPS